MWFQIWARYEKNLEWAEVSSFLEYHKQASYKVNLLVQIILTILSTN